MNTPPARSLAVPWVALTLFCLIVLGVTARSVADGLSVIATPSPHLFVDPFGRFSAVSMPSWHEGTAPLQYTDEMVAADGQPIPLPARVAGQAGLALAARCDAVARRASPAINITFRRGKGTFVVTRRLTPTTRSDAVFFLMLYHIASLLLLWVGIAVWLLSTERNGARAFAFWAFGVSLFFATFTDYHTRARFRPLFSLGSGWLLLGLISVVYAFPDTPRTLAVAAQRLWRGSMAVAGAITAWAAVAPVVGVEAYWARLLIGNGVVVALLLLALVLLARFLTATGRSREELRSVLLGVTLAPVVIAMGFGTLATTGAATIHFFLPLLTSVIPLAIGWALVRHNILGANAVLTRRLLVFPVVLMSLFIGVGVWLALRSDGASGMETLLPVLTASVSFAAVVAGLWRLVVRVLFPATAAFRPTIEQLAETLTDLDHRGDLRETLERTVSRWLPSGRVRLRAANDMVGIDHLPDDALGRLDAGEKVWTLDTPWQRHLLVPMRSLGELRGVLDIAPKHQGALFTEEDLALLDTIAALGAIALHNAEVIAALDAARRIEIEATRDDKRLTLGVLGAELSHEIAHPLQFFRGLVRRGAKRALDPDDVAIGEEEIERMDRMLSSLRRLEPPPRNDVAVALAEPVARAWVLVREVVRDRELQEHVELPDGCTVVADRDGVVQVFANLLRNAVQAAPRGGHVGVRGRVTDDGALRLDVWDNGPGVPPALVETLFHRWVTSRGGDGGSGLGLSVAQNLVNAFGWQIEYVRDEGRTCFRITVPRDKVTVG